MPREGGFEEQNPTSKRLALKTSPRLWPRVVGKFTSLVQTEKLMVTALAFLLRDDLLGSLRARTLGVVDFKKSLRAQGFLSRRSRSTRGRPWASRRFDGPSSRPNGASAIAIRRS